ncbi:hypothetical protein IP88_11340 [alpha proteobacterium AAP81b]|nr:hypothetical protein IP88_11340 [alpha proteobacterium AAP81b]
MLRYSIYLTLPAGSGADPVTALDWHIVGFTEADRGVGRGTPATDADTTEKLIAEFLAAPEVARPDADGKPPAQADALLDFTTFGKQLVVFRLVGGLWQFAAPGITTKLPQAGPGYAGLVGYRLTDCGAEEFADASGCRAVSFEVSEAIEAGTTAINFHVDFVDAGSKRLLPVIIDPDGSNLPKPPG